MSTRFVAFCSSWKGKVSETLKTGVSPLRKASVGFSKLNIEMFLATMRSYSPGMLPQVPTLDLLRKTFELTTLVMRELDIGEKAMVST